MLAQPGVSLIDEVVSGEAVLLRADEITDYDPLIEYIGNARFVLIGEASHGTHEFYRERAQITKRLILEKGFDAVAVEADFPDAYRVNRYVKNESSDLDAVESLAGFKRFPQWMWRNADVLDFIGWLRTHNDDLPENKHKTGFYGLDLYSLHASMEAVLAYLDKVDPDGAVRVHRLRHQQLRAHPVGRGHQLRLLQLRRHGKQPRKPPDRRVDLLQPLSAFRSLASTRSSNSLSSSRDARLTSPGGTDVLRETISSSPSRTLGS